ncbi:MAG: hypothetical protein GY834_14010 [Bacteroidetes bacterium]|nr:hypothetical protein [Bacteroidota bacterium]
MAPEAYRKGTLGRSVEGIHEKLSKTGMPPAIFMAIAGPDVFAFVFGEDWRFAGEYAQWLALPMYFGFVTSPLSAVFNVVGKQHLNMLMQFLLMLFRIVPLIVFSYFNDVMTMVAAYSIGSGLGYLIYLAVSFRTAGLKISYIFHALVSDVIRSTIYLCPLIMTEYWLKNFIELGYGLSFGLLLFVEYRALKSYGFKVNIR